MYIYVEYIYVYINGAIGQSRLQKKNCLNYIEVAG